VPTVPRLGSQVRAQATNIRPSNVRSPQTRVDTRGAQAFGQATVELAKTAVAIEEKERRKADELAFLRADQAASEYETTFLYDKDTGAMNQQGENAFGLPDRMKSEYDKKMNEIMGTLANDRQKSAFEKSYLSRRKSVHKQIYSHMSREGQKFDSAMTESYIANEQDAALKNFHDPERIDLSIQRSRAAILQHSDRNGMPGEYTKMKIQKVESQTYYGVISKILDGGDDLAAKEYYNKYKDRLTGEDQQRVSKLLEAGAIKGESQRKSDQIWANSDGDLGVSMQKAEKIKDPKLRDETMRRLRQKQSDRQAAIKAAENRNFMQASEYVKDNPAVDPKDSMPVSQWEALTLQQQQSLKKYASSPQNNDKIWLDFFDKSPQELAGMSRADFEQKYWVHFDDSHRNRAEKMWKDASEGIENPEVTNSLTFKNRVNNTLRQSGFIDETKTRAKFSDKEAQIYTQFEQEAANRLEDFERNELAGKRKATGQEVQKILDDMVTKKVFIDKNWLWSDPVKPAALITNDEKGEAYVPIKQVPQSDRNSIENLIKSKGGRVSTDKVEKAYAAFLIGDRQLFDRIIGE